MEMTRISGGTAELTLGKLLVGLEGELTFGGQPGGLGS
jgi:hypothetical protein